MVAGAAVVELLGEGDAAGDDVAVVGEVELLAGSSAQPAAKTTPRIVGSRRLVRTTRFSFGLLISFSSFKQD